MRTKFFKPYYIFAVCFFICLLIAILEWTLFQFRLPHLVVLFTVGTVALAATFVPKPAVKTNAILFVVSILFSGYVAEISLFAFRHLTATAPADVAARAGSVLDTVDRYRSKGEEAYPFIYPKVFPVEIGGREMIPLSARRMSSPCFVRKTVFSQRISAIASDSAIRIRHGTIIV